MRACLFTTILYSRDLYLCLHDTHWRAGAEIGDLPHGRRAPTGSVQRSKVRQISKENVA